MSGLKNNKIILIDYQSFPNINYYKLLVKYKELKFEQYEHCQKGSYSNRYYVAGPQGMILLSVPLSHAGKEKIPLRDLRICNRDKWQVIHWRTLTSAYHRSPWFEFYEEELRTLYENKFEYLIDWNMQAFDLVNKWLGLSWKISRTEEYIKSCNDPGMVDARNRITPKNTLDHENFDFPHYRQVFEDRTGFLPGLSILDLLFCEGKKAGELLRSYENE